MTTLVGFAVFGGHLNNAWHISGMPAIALVLPLPFLLLSALRFGPAGASLSLLMTAGILIWMGMDGRGPFSALEPIEAVPAVQTFLIVEAVPLMCLAAVLEERRKAATALRERLGFEKLLSQLSREFVTRTTQEIAERFDGCLANCAAFFSADEVLLLRRKNGEASGFTIPHAWSRQPLESGTDPAWHYDPIVLAVNGGAPAILSSTVMVAPLNAAKHTVGGLAIHALPPRCFVQEDLERMQLIGEVFANVFARMRIEERRARAELEAQQSRSELAHFNRLSTMGELTASLAHELNQPLTGILGNAQAAQRMLASQPVDMDELREILSDIVADDQRAGETIQRMRKLLRRTEGDIVPLDINDVIHEVAGLLKSDAIIRNLRLELNLWPAPLQVRGDQVELRQLVLNLILNAMDAMAHSRTPESAIVVTSARAGGHVHVSVQDCGEGIPPEAAEHIFDPFYTTKPNGMGMGLSIARSIVESHGGSIWMTSNADHGALFEFKLPL
jgi:signal transduction histidine kinase